MPTRLAVRGFLLLACVTLPLHAQQSAAFDYQRLIRSRTTVAPLGDDLGERVDFATGRTEFVAVDVALPGNGTLQVAVGRRFIVENRHAGAPRAEAFGDWQL